MRKAQNAVLALMFLCSSAAFGASDVATWNRNIEYLDFYTSTPNGGDNAFFTYVANATSGANVVLLYPATNSMREFTQRLYRIRTAPPAPGSLGGTGCANDYLNGLPYFMPLNVNPPIGQAAMQGVWAPGKPYPDPGKTYTTKGQDDGMGGADSLTASLGSTSNQHYYQYGDWPGPDGSASGVPGNSQTLVGACDAAAGGAGANSTACQACVTSNGYWLNPTPPLGNKDVSTSAGVFHKGWLRFHPPKWTLLSLAYKRLVNGPLLSALREGVLATNGNTGATMIQKMLPQSCNGSGRPLEQKRRAIDNLQYTNSARPLAEMLFNTAWFMAGQDSDPAVIAPWSWTLGKRPTLCGGGGCQFSSSKSGPCNGCNSDFVILFSDGRGDSANPQCAATASGAFSPIAGATTLDCDGAGVEGSPSTSSGSFGVNGATCSLYVCSGGFWCARSGGLANDCTGYTNGTQTCPAESTVGGAFCNATAACSTAGLGAEMDGDEFELDPILNPASQVTTMISGAGVRLPAAAGTCDMDLADEVSSWMFNNNVSTQGSAAQITTHVVGVGDPSNTHGEMSILQSVATRGNGNYVSADNFADLEDVIEQIFISIRSAATSFASSAVTTVQTTGTSSAFIPRFTPAISGPWSGSLSRYVLFNEFAAGCTVGTLSDTYLNPNQDTSCSDFYLKDRNGNFIQEDSKGNFVISNTSVAWDAGWPMAVGTDGGTVLAVPYWEAGAKLYSRETQIVAFDNLAGSLPANGRRKIYTAEPSGTCIDDTGCYSSTMRLFDPSVPASVTAIAPLLGLGADQNSEVCLAISGATGKPYTSLAMCAEDVMRYIVGEDMLRSNPANRVSPAPAYPAPREKVLGDIFHSSPILVTPPVPKFLCDLGVVNQCVATLYSVGAGAPKVAYDAYSLANATRSSNVLVGANDGMLHAFNASNADAGTDGGLEFDEGTGEESWAFIPPGILPKLVRNMIGERHELLVDGTAMVRDIWVDGCFGTTPCVAADNTKQAGEFHTIAIIGERQGGRGYTALDVTNPATPAFLWSWPPPGTREAMAMGQTWNDIGGAPSAIGPVKLNGVERHIVAFGGGYDQNMIRGRSFHVLDAWTGAELYRYSAADPTVDLRKNLGPVAAPISLLDSDSDYYFDYAVFGDLHGTLWTVSMKDDTFNVGSGVFTQWHVGRAFEQKRGATFDQKNPFFQRVAAGILPTGDIRVFLGSGDRAHLKDSNGGTCGPDNIAACIRRDCDVTVTDTRYSIAPSPVTGSSGKFIGGNFRYNGGNTTAVSMNSLTYDTGGIPTSASSDQMRAQTTYRIACTGPAVGDAGYAYCDWGATDAGTMCPVDVPLEGMTVSQSATPTIADTRFYSVKLFDNGSRTKFTTAAGATTYDGARLTDGTGTTLKNVTLCPGTCPASNITDDGWFLTHGTAQPGANATTHKQDEKTAASALLFGGCVIWSTLDPTGVGGTSGSGAGTCAAGAPSNANGSCSSNSDCGGGTGVCGVAPDGYTGNDTGDSCSDPGDCDGRCAWGRDNGDDCQTNGDCRDSAPCRGYGGCAAVNYCVGLGSLSCTPSFPKDTAWSYQSDAVTGNISCGLAGSQSSLNTTTRAVSKQVSVAPTQPAPVVSVNAATGMIQYSAVTIDATSSPGGTVLGSAQISSTVHWLEVPRKVHDCRHGDGGFPSPYCL